MFRQNGRTICCIFGSCSKCPGALKAIGCLLSDIFRNPHGCELWVVHCQSASLRIRKTQFLNVFQLLRPKNVLVQIDLDDDRAADKLCHEQIVNHRLGNSKTDGNDGVTSMKSL